MYIYIIQTVCRCCHVHGTQWVRKPGDELAPNLDFETEAKTLSFKSYDITIN